jgi:hypothetical protein
MSVPEPEARQVVARDDLLAAQSAELVSFHADPVRDDLLIAQFWNGDPACYGAMVRLEETADQVNVEVLTGVLPEASDRIALAVAELQELRVQLAAPLSGRRVHPRR